MTGLSPTARKILRLACILPPTLAGSLFLLVLWGSYGQDYPHFEHGCLSLEEFLDVMLPHERALFLVAGPFAVDWAYGLALAALIAFGIRACIAHAKKRELKAFEPDVRVPKP